MKKINKSNFIVALSWISLFCLLGCAPKQAQPTAHPAEGENLEVEATPIEDEAPVEKEKDVLVGRWEGAISIMGQDLKIFVDFNERADALEGTIDVLQQGAVGLALTKIKREGDSVHFELIAGPTVAIFDGLLSGESIKGDFTQAGVKGAFFIDKGSAQATDTSGSTDKREPVPYKEEEVSIQNGEIVLAGTLSIPEGAGPFPAAIMITGSGPQNRDEEVFGFKPFEIIADHLTRKGVAVLRCDDRGVGGSNGDAEQATAKDFAVDVLAQTEFLQEREEIAKDKIGLIGHSLGGIIAPLANREDKFAFMVLISGPGVNGKKIVLEQIAMILKANGAKNAEIKEAVATQKKIFKLMDKPDGEKKIEKELEISAKKRLEKMTTEQREAVADPEKFVKATIDAGSALIKRPELRFFMSYEPAPALKEVKCPVLALFGEKDTQISPKQNIKPMKRAFKKGGNRDVTFKVFTDANHLYQKAETGSPAEYASLEKKFVSGFLETISSWILEKTNSAD